MNILITGAGSSAGTPVEMYLVIFALLLVYELVYFRIADKCNIIDKPNERSSHTSVVLRGGGIIFLIGAWIWSAFFGFAYPWFLVGLTLVAVVLVLGLSYLLFIKKYYHLHEKYLKSLK